MNNILPSLLILCGVFLKLHASDLFVGLSQHQERLVLTPCDTDEDCDNLQNAICENNFCQCNGTQICEDKTETVVTKIGEVCKIKADCNIEHSVCEDGKCACARGRVGSDNGRRCLIVANSLGDSCEESVQCYNKTLHSGCKDGKCVCQQQMHAYNGSCYKDTALGEQCKYQGECSNVMFSKCINEQCVCKEGYIQNGTSRCLEIATKIGAPCIENIQCSNFGRANCKTGNCQCDEMYQFKWSNQKCMRDMFIGETCENHTDCHGPEPGESRLECILGECKCMSDYVEEHGYCASCGTRDGIYPHFVLAFLLISLCVYPCHELLWINFIYGIAFVLYKLAGIPFYICGTENNQTERISVPPGQIDE